MIDPSETSLIHGGRMPAYLQDDEIRDVMKDVRHSGGTATLTEFNQHYGENAGLLRWILIPRYVIERDRFVVLTHEGEACANGRPLLRWPINLEPDGSVVAQNGEVLGTWEVDENEHPSFTSLDGTVRLFDVFTKFLCEKIEKWQEERLG